MPTFDVEFTIEIQDSITVVCDTKEQAEAVAQSQVRMLDFNKMDSMIEIDDIHET